MPTRGAWGACTRTCRAGATPTSLSWPGAARLHTCALCVSRSCVHVCAHRRACEVSCAQGERSVSPDRHSHTCTRTHHRPYFNPPAAVATRCRRASPRCPSRRWWCGAARTASSTQRCVSMCVCVHASWAAQMHCYAGMHAHTCTRAHTNARAVLTTPLHAQPPLSSVRRHVHGRAARRAPGVGGRVRPLRAPGAAAAAL